MIWIRNVTKNPKKTGWHLYAVYINERFIIKFRHKRENDLSVLFEKALEAIKERQAEDLIKISKLLKK